MSDRIKGSMSIKSLGCVSTPPHSGSAEVSKQPAAHGFVHHSQHAIKNHLRSDYHSNGHHTIISGITFSVSCDFV